MIKSKRGMSAWIWILIILIIVAVGVGIYIWLSGDSSPIANAGTSGGSSISQPPALPTD
jgi:flagellar basal body-associated protein FliL